MEKNKIKEIWDDWFKKENVITFDKILESLKTLINEIYKFKDLSNKTAIDLQILTEKIVKYFNLNYYDLLIYLHKENKDEI